MSLSRLRRTGFGPAILALTVALAPVTVHSQVGDISDVNYPGWIPSDRVDPEIDIVPVYDAISASCRNPTSW